MNFNDIDLRLRRVYTDVGSLNKYGNDIFPSIKYSNEKVSDNLMKLTISFGGSGDDPETLNQVIGVICNIANLKDHLITKVIQSGKTKAIVEDHIDSSLPLKLVIDISNQEKHGYPLLKRRRSMLDPRMINVRGFLRTSDKPDNIEYHGPGGSMALNMMLVVDADIVDKDGNHLYTLDGLVDGAINDWENLINTHQLNQIIP